MTGWPAGKRKVITLCGSTRFMEQFNDASFWLTINGHVVLSLGSFLHSDDDPAIRDVVLARRTQLDDLHKYKIDMSDAIMVVDVNDYTGESTQSEVEHAIKKGKPVYSYTQSRKAARTLSILVHCDPEVLESWLTTKPTTQQYHHARTNDNLVPETALEPRPQPSYHLTAAGLVAPPSGSIATHSSIAMAVPQTPSSYYSTSSMCKHCLHHANCHYTDDRYGETYCTACANAKCHKLSEFVESDDEKMVITRT